MNKPVLLSVAAVLATGVGAALLWRTAGTAQALVAEQDESPIAGGPSRATLAAEGESAPSGQSTSPPDERNSQARQPLAGSTPYRDFQVRDDPDSLARYRETLEREYAKKGKALALRPEEVNRIVDTLFRLRQESLREIREIRPTNPAGLWLEDEATEMLRLQQLARQRVDIEMMTLLGSKFTQWKESTLMAGTLASVDNLETLMEMSDVRPLTSEQADSLATALAAERVRILRDTGADQTIAPGTGTVTRRMLEDAHSKRLEALQGSVAAREASGRFR